MKYELNSIWYFLFQVLANLPENFYGDSKNNVRIFSVLQKMLQILAIIEIVENICTEYDMEQEHTG